MTKMTLEQMRDLRETKKTEITRLNEKSTRIIIGMGTCGIAAGAQKTSDAFLGELSSYDIKDAKITSTGCMGLCFSEPTVEIAVPGMPKTIYGNVDADIARRIVKEHIIGKLPVADYAFDKPAADIITEDDDDKIQKRIVLRNCGEINPESINEYIVRDGYAALEKVVFEMTGDEVIEELCNAGMRGRGGAGFPTGLKWKFTKNVDADQKYIVCNADEGDPGAYMDRSTAEGDPHSILEAMAIAGKTVGANQGFIYIRAEYPLD